jgi:hypothetical protein
MIALLGLGLTLSLSPGVSFAQALAQEDHLAQAISHTREAVVAGREGNPSSLVEHATAALEHAVAAQKEKPNAHVKSGINRLKQVIKYGKAKRGYATKIANYALQEFERAPN